MDTEPQPDADADLDDPHEPDTTATPEVDPTLPCALTPQVTAPISVQRPPPFAGGWRAAGAGINDALRKVGGLRGLKLVAQIHAPEGLDCPGCAWPGPTGSGRFLACEGGIRAVADQASIRQADPRLFETYTNRELCERSDHWLNERGRLSHPMVRRPGSANYVPIDWDAAIAMIAEAMGALDDPSQAVFYGSGRASNEAAFTLQLLARQLGTNNLPHSSNFCHSVSDRALREQLAPLGPEHARIATLADFDTADAIFCLGHNPGSNHPRMLQTLRAAKLRGATLVAVNPLREVGLSRYKDVRARGGRIGNGTALCDLHLPVHIGGDRAVLAGLMKGTIEAGAVDREFIDAHTEGYAELEAELEAATWASLATASGVAEADLRRAAEIYASAPRTIICWGTGLTQHSDGAETLSALTSLLLLRRNLGRPGTGPFPMRGHHNALGSQRVGLRHDPAPGLLAALAEHCDIEAPQTPGLDVLDSLAALHEGRVALVFNLAGNLLSAAPDTAYSAEALRRASLIVHLSTKLNRGHLIGGGAALLLPCLARTELDPAGRISTEDASGQRRFSIGSRAPASPELRSATAILAAVGAAVFPRATWPALADNYEVLRATMDAVAGPPGPPMPAPRTLGRAQLRCGLPPARTLADDELVLTTVRSHDQHNSIIYERGDRLRGIWGYRRLLLISLADLERLGLEPYDQVDLSSEFAGRTRLAPRWLVVPHAIPERCCAAYFPEANALVPFEHRDPVGRTPSSKSVVVKIAKSAALPERKPLQRLRR